MPRVQARPCSDLGDRDAVALEAQNFALCGRAEDKQLLPEFVRLHNLEGLRLGARREWRFAVAAVTADLIDQPMVGQLRQERAELVSVVEPPAQFAEPAQHFDPDRLDNIGSVELGAEFGRKPPPNNHPEVGFVLANESRDRLAVARGQADQQRVGRLASHDSPSGERRWRAYGRRGERRRRGDAGQHRREEHRTDSGVGKVGRRPRGDAEG